MENRNVTGNREPCWVACDGEWHPAEVLAWVTDQGFPAAIVVQPEGRVSVVPVRSVWLGDRRPRVELPGAYEPAM